jgi:hypothetical protein
MDSRRRSFASFRFVISSFRLILLAVVCIPTAAFARSQFFDPVYYSAGVAPGAIAAGDFNGDGKLDLVTLSCCGGANIFHVLLGRGDGTFGPATQFFAHLAGFQVSVGDMNGDKALDLVVTSNPGVAIFLGNGDGTFQPASIYPAGSFPIGEAVVDFNGDGNLDVAATSQTDGAVDILLGNGDGTLQSAVSYAAPAARGIAVGDFNGDHIRDLVTSGDFPPYSVNVLLGNGDGTFQPAVHVPTRIPALAVSVADFNHDGKRDIVAIGTSYDRQIAVLLGNGHGRFARAIVSTENFNVSQIAPGDFDQDGFADLMVIDLLNAVAQVLKGKGDGTFGFNGSYRLGGFRLVAADFDGDGFLDVGVTNAEAAGAVAVLINRGK